jgi:Na+/proline symporter
LQRVIVLVLGLLSIGLAFASENFFSVAMYAYTLYGATLTPAVVCALVWPDVPRGAIVGGMLAGLATALVWKLALVLERMPAALTPVEPVLPALGVHLLALIGLAIAFRRPT